MYIHIYMCIYIYPGTIICVWVKMIDLKKWMV